MILLILHKIQSNINEQPLQRLENLRNICRSMLAISQLSSSGHHMSLVVRKPVFGVSDQVSHNRAVQSLNMARGLKFWI